PRSRSSPNRSRRAEGKNAAGGPEAKAQKAGARRRGTGKPAASRLFLLLPVLLRAFASRSALEDALEVLQVVDDAPVAGPGAAHPVLPPLEAVQVAPRIDVVGIELGHVERHHPSALQVQRDVAHGALVELLLQVGEIGRASWRARG